MSQQGGSATIDKVRSLAAAGDVVALVTVVSGSRAGAKLIVTRDEQRGTLGDEALDREAAARARTLLDVEQSATVPLTDDIEAFVDVYPPRRKLIVFGAVHIAQALVTMAAPFAFEIIVVDARGALATRERFPNVDRLVVAWPDEALSEIDVQARDVIVVLTHDPKFDEPALVSALATPAGYIGAVGSRKTSDERSDRLAAHGLTADEIARIHGPIGLDIGGKTPEEMAVSILAEVIAVTYGRNGGMLAEARGPIRGDA